MENTHEKGETPKEKKIIITGEYTVDDAKRIKEAFENGELSHLGITKVTIGPSLGTEQSQEQWRRTEQQKRPQGRDDGAPPL